MEREALTVEEIAEILQMTRDTIRKWIRTGELKALNLEGRYRVLPHDFEQFKVKHLATRGSTSGEKKDGQAAIKEAGV